MPRTEKPASNSALARSDGAAAVPVATPSSVEISSDAERGPTALGAKRTLKFRLLLGAIITGNTVGLVMVKSLALGPVNDMLLMVSGAVPEFRITNVLVALCPTVSEPKSVPSTVAGVVSPLLMTTALPLRVIPARGTAEKRAITAQSARIAAVLNVVPLSVPLHPTTEATL